MVVEVRVASRVTAKEHINIVQVGHKVQKASGRYVGPGTVITAYRIP